MLAYRIQKSSEKKELILTEVILPELKDYEILIKTSYIGLNRADLYELTTNYNSQDTDNIPGLEISGIIIKLGKKVSNFKIGDKVCALLSNGGYASEVIADSRLSFLVPENMELAQAASILEGLFTTYMNIVELAKAKSGESILINAGASGIGIIAIQLARHLGLRVFTTISSEEKKIKCLSLGSNYAINYKEQDVSKEIQILTENKKLDIVLDCFGGEFFDINCKCLKYKGRLLVIGLIKNNVATINFGRILMNNITIFSSTLRSQSLKYKINLKKKIEKHIWNLVESAEIKQVIDRVFPFDKANDALNYMKDGKHIGKILLKL